MIKYYQSNGMWIVDVPETAKFKIVPLKGKTQDEYQKQESPSAQINGSLYNGSWRKPIGTVIYEGEMVNNAGYGFGFGVDKDGAEFGGPWSKYWSSFITGYPGIICNGNKMVWTINDQKVFVPSTRRSAIARKGNRIFFIATVGNMSLSTFVDRMLAIGIDDAINLDGGGSSRLYANGKCINRPTDNRRVANIIAVWDEKKEEEMSSGDFITVCLDAGHGIEVVGKCSPDKTYYEHEFALDVAKKTKAYLERHGIKVIMTRLDEHDVALEKRCYIANNAQANVYVSLHSNAAGDEGWYDVEGWSAHIVGRGGQAEILANNLRAEAISFLDCADRGVQVNNYQVLRDTTMPAVLIEHGFHTSKNEVEKLKSAEYREKCAISNARGILKYFGLNWVEEIEKEENLNMEGISVVATRWQMVYTSTGEVDAGRCIDVGDKCVIGAINNNLLIPIIYPTSKGHRSAYIKSLEWFKK